MRADKSLVICYFSLGLCLHLLANPKQTFPFSAYQRRVNKSLCAFYKYSQFLHYKWPFYSLLGYRELEPCPGGSLRMQHLMTVPPSTDAARRECSWIAALQQVALRHQVCTTGCDFTGVWQCYGWYKASLSMPVSPHGQELFLCMPLPHRLSRSCAKGTDVLSSLQSLRQKR